MAEGVNAGIATLLLVLLLVMAMIGMFVGRLVLLQKRVADQRAGEASSSELMRPWPEIRCRCAERVGT